MLSPALSVSLVLTLQLSLVILAARAEPPAASASASTVAVSEPHPFFGQQVDIVALLPPPPREDSAAQQADLAAVLEAQRAAHANGDIAHAVADVQSSCGRFSDALGYDLTSAGAARVLAFLDQTARQGSLISVPAKRYWRRTRPYAYSPEVEPLGDMPARAKTTLGSNVIGSGSGSGGSGGSGSGGTGGTGGQLTAEQLRAADDLAHSSYPSGHTTFGTLCAILLAEMVPEKRAALFARNLDYDHSRMVVGAHFPTDLEAGRLAGTVAGALMLEDAGVQRQLAEARSSLRAALGLPPIYPPLYIDIYRVALTRAVRAGPGERQAARATVRVRCGIGSSSRLASVQCHSSSSPARVSTSAEQLSTQSPSLQ
jgi:acid phosphatase (class A)